MPAPEIKLSTDSRGVATITFRGIKSLNIVGSAEVEGQVRPRFPAAAPRAAETE